MPQTYCQGKRGTVIDTPAPALNKIAISPPEQAQASGKRKQVQAAVDFGAILEEASGHVQELLQKQSAPPPEDEVLFPQDLLVSRPPNERLQSNLRRLKALEQVLLPSEDKPYVTAFPSNSGQPNTDETDMDLDTTIQELQKPPSIGDLNLSKKLILWDKAVIHKILDLDSNQAGADSADTTEVLNGYMVGKALSLTRWQIGFTAQQSLDGSNQSGSNWQGEWQESFKKKRIAAIQRRLNVSNLLDPQTTTVVATSLGYWYHGFNPRTPSSQVSSREDNTSPPLEISSLEDNQLLLEALEEQLANWLDLLTERRPLESFTVTGVVSTLTKDLIATKWAAVSRFVVPILAFVVILVTLGVAVYFLIKLAAAPPAATGAHVGGLLGSVGTALGTAFTFMVVRGKSLFNRGSGDIDRLRERLGELEDKVRDQVQGVDKVPGEVATKLGLSQPSWQGLKQDVLSQVVAQIRLEEFNLAVSEPLINWVFISHGNDAQRSDNRLTDVKNFIKLVYAEDKTNLDRLQDIFEGLYKNYQPPPSGGA